MSIAKFPLPDVGEGLTEAEIVSWKVKPGDKVSVNQTICEIETAKSVVELPCPFAGEVTELLANEGDTVEVGSPIIAVKVSGASPIPTISEFDAPAAGAEPDTGAEYKLPTLVGYGDTGESKSRRKRAVNVAPVTTAIPIPVIASSDAVASVVSDSVIAKPPIRKLAKELNVDLAKVRGTGLHGDVTRGSEEVV